MLTRYNLLRLLAAAVVISLLAASCGPIAEELPEIGPPGEDEGPAEEPAPTEPPAEPESTQPPPEPEPTEPPPEPEATTPPPPEPEPEPPEPGEQPSWDIGRLLLWGVALTLVLGIVIGVIIYFAGGRGAEEAPPELPSVPITTVAQDIKEGRVSKIVVCGEDLTVTRIDGLVMVSHKEPTADLLQLLTNLGVTPEQMSEVIINVE